LRLYWKPMILFCIQKWLWFESKLLFSNNLPGENIVNPRIAHWLLKF
jgi:hypothetical protein